MNEAAIQQIVCRALVSERFRHRLLGEDREDVLRTSDLDPRELEAFMAIPAETIEEFAAGVERVMRGWRKATNRVHHRETLPTPSPIPLTAPRGGGR
jgi:hypothetical protein